MTATPGASLDLSRLVAEVTARIDGYRHWAGDATWEATPGGRPDEIVMVRLTQDGATEYRTVRVNLEER
jgi:hypothetical protein